MITLNLFSKDFKYKLLKDRKILMALVTLILFYGIFVYANINNYVQIDERTEYDETFSHVMRIPLTEPVEKSSYFMEFLGWEMRGADKNQGIVKYIFLPESTNVLVGNELFLFLMSAFIMILLGHNEISELREKGTLRTFLSCPIEKKNLLDAKVMLGLSVSIILFITYSLILFLLAAIKNIQFTDTQLSQVLCYNGAYSIFMFIIYNLTLMLSTKDCNSGYVLVKSLVILLILTFLIPMLIDVMEYSVIQYWAEGKKIDDLTITEKSQLVKRWYRYIHYIDIINPLGSFAKFSTEVLQPYAAQFNYLDLSWARQVVSFGTINLQKILRVSIIKYLTFLLWIIVPYAISIRRFNKSDV